MIFTPWVGQAIAFGCIGMLLGIVVGIVGYVFGWQPFTP